ncbi:hypothetical protein NQ314_018256 [Rhamnusium bicolor]|uniref:Aminomethyltransferase, mitochondrial n=1 Tax=Rhamnusium bicolor TaxID=1586634 RepID=A0AAV8WS69_9CUCU|nr:hypothetical protein NQ314_018256 [Rhamnusium bicolor]
MACGYTGEDGFEISMPASSAVKLARELIRDENVKLAGLGARDSLRLEAGLCLYGNDITIETTPVDSALTCHKSLNTFFVTGLVSKQGPPARQGATILSEDGQELGKITSGCPSPSLGSNIAMGYVPTSYSKVGTNVNLKIRDKVYEAVVAKMPFVKANYYNKPK